MRVKLLLLFIRSIKFSPKITCHKRSESTRTIIWILDLHILLRMILKIPRCVVCMKTFSNSTMKPASLKQHLANAHPSMMSKNRSFFESKLSSLKRQKLDTLECFGALTKPQYMHHMPLLYMWQKLKSHITLVKPF